MMNTKITIIALALMGCSGRPVPPDVDASVDASVDVVADISVADVVPDADNTEAIEQCKFMARAYADCVVVTTNPNLPADQYDEIVAGGYSICEKNPGARQHSVTQYLRCVSDGTVYLSVNGTPCLVTCGEG